MNLTLDHKLKDRSCWRFSFRYHLDQSKATNGFMIQVQEKHGLSDRQKIETEMAKQAGVKIFRTTTTSEDVSGRSLDYLKNAIQEWYINDCKDMELKRVPLCY